MTKTSAHMANCNIGRLIEAEAMQMGMDAFFKKNIYEWRDPQEGESLRSFAKAATRNLPDYCSFDAFFAKFEDRFAAWFTTGNFDGIADDPAEE